jgi:predicted phage-related endonuclease
MSIEITFEAMERRTSFLLGLSDDDKAERLKGLGASDANIILGGDQEKIAHLWRVKRGEAEPEDLSDILAVQMGTWTEQFIIFWFERQTGLRVTNRKETFAHAKHDYIVARPEGLIGEDGLLECKHVGPFNYSLEGTIARYRPQLAVQMACANREKAHISVFSGNSKWETEVVERDAIYEAQVIGELVKFWGHVQSGTWPTNIEPPEAPMPVALMRKENFATNNAWVSLEQDYVTNELVAKTFENAKKGLKELVADDVSEVTGKLLKVKRSKSGALSFSRIKGE